MTHSQSKSSTCSVIIVTHNSQAYLDTCLEAIRKQTHLPHQVIIVDSGSEQIDYLKAYAKEAYIHLDLQKDNVGFCKGNNLGMSHVFSHTDYVLFLNPDAFLTPAFIEQAVACMEEEGAHDRGALSGLLLGYDMQANLPTGYVDSSGIFRTWYGRWYDRDQGQSYVQEKYAKPEVVPALCGALLFCRYRALKSVWLAEHQVMDPAFYMYKEDIDLSLRLRRKGWTLHFFPHLVAHHCRGWQRDRSQVPRHLRLLSAKNEMRLYARLGSPCYLYSAFKYWMVKVLDV